jgi:hypothetical protein
MLIVRKMKVKQRRAQLSGSIQIANNIVHTSFKEPFSVKTKESEDAVQTHVADMYNTCIFFLVYSCISL